MYTNERFVVFDSVLKRTIYQIYREKETSVCRASWQREKRESMSVIVKFGLVQNLTKICWSSLQTTKNSSMELAVILLTLILLTQISVTFFIKNSCFFT